MENNQKFHALDSTIINVVEEYKQKFYNWNINISIYNSYTKNFYTLVKTNKSLQTPNNTYQIILGKYNLNSKFVSMQEYYCNSPKEIKQILDFFLNNPQEYNPKPSEDALDNSYIIPFHKVQDEIEDPLSSLDSID